MNVVLFGNNQITVDIITILKKNNVNIKGFCFTQKKFQKKKNEIKKILPKSTKIFIYSKKKAFSDKLRKLKCNMAFSISFSHILENDIINIFNRGIINLHFSYLPYCRGSAPNVFSIINNEPIGSTLHFINEKIDAGDIIAQKKIEISKLDTGGTLYRKLYLNSLNLFKKNIKNILSNKISLKKINIKKGSIYYHKQLKEIDKINLNKKYKAEELINLLRARTFENYKSAYFYDNKKKKIFVRVNLSYK